MRNLRIGELESLRRNQRAAARPHLQRPRLDAVTGPAGRCACGGVCPRCQAAGAAALLRMSRPHDALERQADRIADRATGAEAAAEPLRSAQASSAAASYVPMSGIVRAALDSPSQPLDASVRRQMEASLGGSLRHVRIHAGAEAARSAQQLEARAYTLGSHIVFDRGQYDPRSHSGVRLLAHELVHVQQQGGGSDTGVRHGGLVQRMTYGTGSPPTWTGITVASVPVEERARVDAAIRRIRAVVLDPSGYNDCHGFFTARCTNGTPQSMADTFNQVVLWRIVSDPDEDTLARGTVSGVDIGYTRAGYDDGTEGLAATLVHEMMHNCGVTGSRHYLADVAALYCIGAPSTIALALGFPMDDSLFAFLVQYRRLLTAWASGRLGVTAGVDLNAIGAGVDVARALGRNLTEEPAEFGSALLGLRGRTNFPWGGERFGGLTLQLEAGLGAGRFALREPRPGEAETEIGAGVVLQAGIGAEFYLPKNPEVLPLSLQVAYRQVRPLNDEARRIHSVVLQLGASF